MVASDNEVEERLRLSLQIAESYANLFYTYKTQLAAADAVNGLSSALSVVQIVLTSISACGFIGIWLSGIEYVAVVAAGLSVVSLAINIYLKGANLVERGNRYSTSADAIWLVLQKYLSLLADSRSLDLTQIRLRRDDLQNEVASIYKKSPMTSSRAYSKARKSIKAGSCAFSLEEIEQMLPVGLRDLVG